jgi:hypothetical protein
VSWTPLTATAEHLARVLSESELAEYQRLYQSINHALTVATSLPTTLDPRARELIITKLQEADHWSMELLRAAAVSRRLL